MSLQTDITKIAWLSKIEEEGNSLTQTKELDD
jgi:hypothetical protein